MNSLQRVNAVVAGQIPDRVPVCLHNFMMATREAGVSMQDYRSTPEVIARTHLQALEEYGYDCLMIDTDTTMLAEAMGAKSEDFLRMQKLFYVYNLAHCRFPG